LGRFFDAVVVVAVSPLSLASAFGTTTARRVVVLGAAAAFAFVLDSVRIPRLCVRAPVGVARAHAVVVVVAAAVVMETIVTAVARSVRTYVRRARTDVRRSLSGTIWNHKRPYLSFLE
jgi:hypothetical protein